MATSGTGWQEIPEDDAVYLVLSGELAIELGDGETVRLRADETYGVPPGPAHRVRPGAGCAYLRLDLAGAAHPGRIEVA